MGSACLGRLLLATQNRERALMKISIRWALILGCLGLIWGMQLLITSTNYVSSERVLAGHARDIMQNIADLTTTQSKNHLQLAQGAAHLTKRLLASEVVGSDRTHHDMLGRYFLNQLSLYPHFAGIYVGAPNGDFYYVSRSDARVADGFRTKVISHHNGARQTRLIWYDKQGVVLSDEFDPNDTYDPRQRPWYRKALRENSIIWTDPYIFFTSRKPGITVAGPIFLEDGQLQGVVGVDLEINELSTFIDNLRIGKHGRAFLLNNNGDVVAFPDISKIMLEDRSSGNSMRMVKIEELDDGLSKAAFHAIAWSKAEDGLLSLEAPQFATFEYDGRVYNTMFAPFTNAQWPWMIGVYLPENDYLGAIKDNRRLNYLIALILSVVTTLIGLRLSRNIVRPLVGLEKEALAIKKHDLSKEFNTQSGFKEIDETARAFCRMKTSLRNSEEKYRQIFENIQDVYYETELDGKILELSPSVKTLTGFSREELIGQNIGRFYEDLKDRDTYLAQLYTTGQVTDWELKGRNAQGDIEYGSVTASIKYDADGEPEKIIGSLMIITDRKKADLQLRQYQDQLEVLVKERTQELEKSNDQLRSEIRARKEKEEALRRSEEKYRSIIENMDNGYYEMDLGGHLTFCNKPLAAILEYPLEELRELHFRQFLESEALKQFVEMLDTVRKTGAPGRLARYTIKQKNGGRRSIEASTALITGGDGQAIGYRGVVLDITDRLDAEEEKKSLEERLHQVQRLEGIGTLAGGVAHDFNNLLMGIQGNISLMMLEVDPGGTHYSKLKSIESCVASGSELTRQLLGFARGGKYMVKPLDFNEIVANTTRMFGRTRKEIQMVEKVEEHLWTVQADQNQIEQVLLNVYINAWQAMPEGGNIYVETKNVELDAGFVRPYGIQPGRYVRISVSDTGIGMDEAIQRRVFEPFFTTKEMGRGTGLGLASAYGIIKNHDGAIDFVSQVGEGTTFYIYLPASDAVVSRETPSSRNIIQGVETILLVDDEQVVLDVNKPMLESMGYRVLTASGGTSALEIYRQNETDIDLVVLDMVMPDLSGSEVFDRLLEVNPQVKVLLSSGYSLAGQAEEIMSRGCSGFIQKPFSLEQLSKKIRLVLDH
jgi:PAS domain S-box-containing protein